MQSEISLVKKYVGEDPLQTARAGVYFNEVESGGSVKYIPRSVRLCLTKMALSTG